MKVRANDYHRYLAAQYLRKQLKQLGGQFDGIRSATGTEFVHRARVASRRLRAALRMFGDCFPKRMVKRWRKTIRQITRELGDARDRDVQIEFLRDVLCRLEDCSQSPGVARLLVKLELAREELQPQILAAVDRLQASGVIGEMNVAAKAMIPDSSGSDGGVPPTKVSCQLGRYIGEELEELLAHEDSLSRPEDRESHHAMRIVTKRLRYTLEICKPAYDGALDEFLVAVKEVQRLLGEIHDCDVWDEQFGEFLEDQRAWIVKCYGQEAPLSRLQCGVDYLRQQCRRRRAESFQRLVSYWQELGENKVWDRLTQLIKPSADQPPSMT